MLLGAAESAFQRPTGKSSCWSPRSRGTHPPTATPATIALGAIDARFRPGKMGAISAVV